MSTLVQPTSGVSFAARSALTRISDSRTNPQSRKLYRECQQFEGLLIADLWSELEQGTGMGEFASDPGASEMQGLGVESAAAGIARAGGLGIARMLYQALAPDVQRTLSDGGKSNDSTGS